MKWKALKSIINGYGIDKDELFLTLINEEGIILRANATMQRSLHVANPRAFSTNFFNLLHPEDRDTFRKAIEGARSNNGETSAELYLKNGYYHPMKWQVTFVEKDRDNAAQYLCVGYKLVDDERVKQFNDLGEKNYQLIVEGLSAGILMQDAKGELIAANKRAAEIFGSTLERLYQLENIELHWNRWDITNEDGTKVLFKDTPFMKSLATATNQSDVLEMRLPGVESRWVLFNSQPLMEDGQAKPYSVVTNIVDITNETALRLEAKDRDTLFRSFLDKTPNLAWVLDEDAVLQFASASFYQYFGLNEKNAVGRNIYDLIPANVADALHGKHIYVLENGKATKSVEKVKWSDGTHFIFNVDIFPIDVVSGKKLVGGHAVNLADKYEVEKQLREVNERLLLLSRATTDAIWEWDMQTGYIFRNDALMNLIGYHGEEVRGLSWWLRRIHPDDRNRVTDKIKEATDKGHHSWEDEYRFKCFDESYKHIQDRGYVVYENGLPVKMIGSLQDITELKDLEDQLMREKLQRQKEISETVIRVQEKERTRIGHELHDNVNQILSTTKMFLEMLKPTGDEEKKLKGKSIEYLMTAIEEIRKLSKELVVPQLKEKGLVESIFNLTSDIQISTKLKISFVHDVENDLLSPGKKVTLFRIVQEQFKNILKYSKAKKVDVYLSCSNNFVQLIISDDGIGFDTKRTHKGIGISNIHDRAKFYNGTVDLQSAPGKGCQLSVSIPIAN